jgi:hypothetical protein
MPGAYALVAYATQLLPCCVVGTYSLVAVATPLLRVATTPLLRRRNHVPTTSPRPLGPHAIRLLSRAARLSSRHVARGDGAAHQATGGGLRLIRIRRIRPRSNLLAWQQAACWPGNRRLAGLATGVFEDPSDLTLTLGSHSNDELGRCFHCQVFEGGPHRRQSGR